MAYDLQEQEELDNFKRFWNFIGKWLFLLIILSGIGYIAYIGYHQYSQSRNQKAAALLETVAPKFAAKDSAAAAVDLQKMQQDYPKAVATAQATFMAAAVAFDAQKYDVAERHLQWVKNHTQEPFVSALATQRLAVVKLQQKQYDAALKILDEKAPDALMPMLLDTRGDIQAAKGDAAAAKAAYQAALDKLGKEAPQRKYIEAKLKQL